MSEIERLRTEYQQIHQRVLVGSRDERGPEMLALQLREQLIVSRLRQLGAGPYSSDAEIVLREARAL